MRGFISSRRQRSSSRRNCKLVGPNGRKARAIGLDGFGKPGMSTTAGLLCRAFAAERSAQLDLRSKLARAIAKCADGILLFGPPDVLLRHEIIADLTLVQGENIRDPISTMPLLA